MNRLSQLREAAPDTYADAAAALADRSAAADALVEARRAYGVAAAPVDRVARALLSLVCNDLEIPLVERAGWSMAFHDDRNTFNTVDDFARKASEHQARLEAIDASLRPAGTPILAITPGPIGDYRRSSTALRYAIARSSGDGLELHQSYNEGQDWHYHWVDVSEESRSRGRSVYRGFDGGGRSGAVISGITTTQLVEACADPVKVAQEVQHEGDSGRGNYYVIGEQALATFFDEGSNYGGPLFDMLRGAVVFAGITLPD